MNIAIIGYKNHAEKLIKSINKLNQIKKIFVYHPIQKNLSGLRLVSKKIKKTSDFYDLLKADGVIIASRNDSHANYLESLKEKYIFCEKPPAENLKDLTKIKKFNKKKIIFNYHLDKTFFSKYVKKQIENKKLGDPININIEISYGIAFKKNLKNNWRFNKKNIFSTITGNLGIHYIRLLLFWFDDLKVLNIHQRGVQKKNSIDTVNINLLANKKININIFLSYAAPKKNLINIIFTNGMLEFDDGKINEYFPRDQFDKKGQFIKPKVKRIKTFKDSTKHNFIGLEDNLKYFIKTIYCKKFFNLKEFHKDISCAELILKIKKSEIKK